MPAQLPPGPPPAVIDPATGELTTMPVSPEAIAEQERRKAAALAELTLQNQRRKAAEAAARAKRGWGRKRPRTVKQEQQAMTSVLKNSYLQAVRGLHVNSAGKVKCPVTKQGMHTATQVASRLREAGFPSSADQLRSFIGAAGRCRPDPPPDKCAPRPKGLTKSLHRRVCRALESERDVNVLLALVAALKTLPKSKERSFILAALRTLIAQLKASRETGNTLEAVAEVVRDPNPPKGPISTTKKQPPPPPAPAPAPVIDPPPPRPQPAPPPKTALQIQATQTARDLRSKQIQHGMPKAKKYFDVSKVKRLQRLLNETDDGKPGPATFMAMARVGVDDIPIVMFWPRRSTLTTVDEYRQDLLQLAEIALSAGQNNRALGKLVPRG